MIFVKWELSRCRVAVCDLFFTFLDTLFCNIVQRITWVHGKRVHVKWCIDLVILYNSTICGFKFAHKMGREHWTVVKDGYGRWGCMSLPIFVCTLILYNDTLSNHIIVALIVNLKFYQQRGYEFILCPSLINPKLGYVCSSQIFIRVA